MCWPNKNAFISWTKSSQAHAMHVWINDSLTICNAHMFLAPPHILNYLVIFFFHKLLIDKLLTFIRQAFCRTNFCSIRLPMKKSRNVFQLSPQTFCVLNIGIGRVHNTLGHYDVCSRLPTISKRKYRSLTFLWLWYLLLKPKLHSSV